MPSHIYTYNLNLGTVNANNTVSFDNVTDRITLTNDYDVVTVQVANSDPNAPNPPAFQILSQPLAQGGSPVPNRVVINVPIDFNGDGVADNGQTDANGTTVYSSSFALSPEHASVTYNPLGATGTGNRKADFAGLIQHINASNTPQPLNLDLKTERRAITVAGGNASYSKTLDITADGRPDGITFKHAQDEDPAKATITVIDVAPTRTVALP